VKCWHGALPPATVRAPAETLQIGILLVRGHLREGSAGLRQFGVDRFQRGAKRVRPA
jgi:hypothetical protein